MKPAALKEIFLAGKSLGFGVLQSLGDSDVLFFFGDKTCTEEDLSHKFPSLQFVRAKQVHGDQFLEASFIARETVADKSAPLPEADAVWTRELNVAVMVLTADCLPVLAATTKFVAAIHAGWKGILNEISYKTLKSNLENKSPDATVMIGPHIQLESFEVKEDVLSQFLKLPYFLINTHTRPHSDHEKYLIDLKSVAEIQVLNAGIPPENIYYLSLNTFTEARLASYRRERSSNGRNFSFVARLIKNSSII